MSEGRPCLNEKIYELMAVRTIWFVALTRVSFDGFDHRVRVI